MVELGHRTNHQVLFECGVSDQLTLANPKRFELERSEIVREPI